MKKQVKKEVHEFILKSLELRKSRLTGGKLHNIPQAKRNIADWQRELDQNVEFSGSGMIRTKVYKDTNEKLISQEKAWLEKAEKVVEECDQAITYIKNEIKKLGL